MGLILGTRDKEETCLGCFIGDILGKVMSLKTFKVTLPLKIFKVNVF